MVCFFWLRPCLDQIMPRSSQITCPGWSKYSKSKFQTDHQIPWIFQSFDQSFQSLQGQTEKRVAALAGSWLLWKDITTTKANFSPFPHGFTFFFTTRSYTSYHIIRIVSVLTGPPYWLSMIIVIQADQKKPLQAFQSSSNKRSIFSSRDSSPRVVCLVASTRWTTSSPSDTGGKLHISQAAFYWANWPTST